jgi:chemotaxis protein CheD
MASVRMGEMVVSNDPNEELVALGLGSCIGLAIVDRPAGVAGLAHIVLPETNDRGEPVGKFADTAVPELIARMRRAGAAKHRCEAAIVGGARMFEMSGGLDIGSRNEAAVRAELTKARIPVKAAETGGSAGRTLKVAVRELLVTVRAAGQRPEILLEGRARRAAAAAGAGAVS